MEMILRSDLQTVLIVLPLFLVRVRWLQESLNGANHQQSNSLKFNRQPSKKVNLYRQPSKMPININRKKNFKVFQISLFQLILTGFWLLKNL